ncbi:MAG: hypothetical protein R3C61_02960 [Bacteroidia bacterium]
MWKGGFFQLIFSSGTYTLTATIHTGKSGAGTPGMPKTITFSVVSSNLFARTASPAGVVTSLLYPNPAKDMLNINLEEGQAGEVSLNIFTTLGQKC